MLGLNYYGQAGDGSTTDCLTPTQIFLENVASQINIGIKDSCILDNLSDLWCWGNNVWGQLGLVGNNSHENVPVPQKVTSYQYSFDTSKISLVYFHTLLVNDDDNIVMGMGRNFDGQLGVGDNTSRNTPTLLPGF